MTTEEMIIKKKHLYKCEEKLKWWGYGEWVEEVDVVLFEYRHIECRILRSMYKKQGRKDIFGGHLCGYICIPPEHPFYKKRYDDIPIDVHGGLTYGKSEGDDYYIGFDCAHFSDLVPFQQRFIKKKAPRIFEKKNIEILSFVSTNANLW